MIIEKPDYAKLAQKIDSDNVASGKGANIIPPPEREPLWRAYFEKFKDPIIIVLLVAFMLSMCLSLYEIFVMGEGWSLLFEPVGVLVALLLATGVGFIFEVKANREFEILNKVKDSRPVKVLRIAQGECAPRLMQIAKQDVVCGDIVRLESGDEIPADGVLLESVQLCVDESNFTGEPYANKCVDEACFDRDATYKSNFLLRGSTVIEGNGVMRVVAVGVATEEGKGVALASEGSDVQTPLNRQLEQLGGWISRASFIIATLIIVGRMLYYWLSGGFEGAVSWVSIMEFVLASVMIAVTLIVVAVPEGLPMSITVSLALSMRRMLKENSLVRKLHACETMGATTVICTDKTGTLTKNRMTVMEVEVGDNAVIEHLYRNMSVNSTAELTLEDGALSVIGNPTEGALLMWLKGKGVDYAAYRSSSVVSDQVPFSTESKYMSTTVVDKCGSVRYVKGAPEIVMAMCNAMAGGRTSEEYEVLLRSYQERAMRTLGFAMQRVAEDGVCEDMLFLGVVGIADPIREDVAEAIDTCMNSAGVRVIIVTGDTPGTAREIGRQIGLVATAEEGSIITGPEFAALTDEEARELLRGERLKIISRARPDDKARLVMLLQANGEVVAVTGDGTNDAPALSKAQVGLSMGDGTSRAKEASDITIIDNSFASINKAIMWGRSLYLNIRRFIIFQMTINLCACLIVLAGAFMGLESPLTVTQMLWVNLIMDTFAAMALSSLPPDRRVLCEGPRKPDSHIIDRAMVRSIVGGGLCFFAILVALWQFMWHTEVDSVRDMLTLDALRIFTLDIFSSSAPSAELTLYEMGIFFSIFVMLQFWNLFNAKYFRTGRSLMLDVVDIFRSPRKVRESYNGMYLAILAVILCGQVLIVNFAGKFFGVAPLAVMDWVWILLITMPVLLIPDVVRFIKRD
ncbi:MAG: calcium-translocating P-type ATPase, PMCA-type [Alistipes sp.]|nr:calcium-translocating P-type ATPase, PMCA-type [Alistipes sp.]